MGLSIVVAASRQSWAFSRDGALPFSSFLRVISQRMGYIPLRAIWACVAMAIILGLLSLIAPAAAQALFSLAAAGNNLAWGVPIFARLVWGQHKFTPGPFYTGKFSIPLGWTAVVFLVFGIVIACFPVGGPDPTPQSMNYTVVINCAVWLGALAYYFIGKSPNPIVHTFLAYNDIDARKWFTGPRITLDAEVLTEEQIKAVQEEGIKIEGASAKSSGASI